VLALAAAAHDSRGCLSRIRAVTRDKLSLSSPLFAALRVQGCLRGATMLQGMLRDCSTICACGAAQPAAALRRLRMHLSGGLSGSRSSEPT